jgi:hypothetical protein
MKYTVYIKSHCEFPDYEDSCLADSVDEAVKKLQWNMAKHGEDVFGKEEIQKNLIMESSCFCPMCHEEQMVKGKCEKCRKNPMRSVILAYGTEEEKKEVA